MKEILSDERTIITEYAPVGHLSELYYRPTHSAKTLQSNSPLGWQNAKITSSQETIEILAPSVPKAP